MTLHAGLALLDNCVI